MLSVKFSFFYCDFRLFWQINCTQNMCRELERESVTKTVYKTYSQGAGIQYTILWCVLLTQYQYSILKYHVIINIVISCQHELDNTVLMWFDILSFSLFHCGCYIAAPLFYNPGLITQGLVQTVSLCLIISRLSMHSQLQQYKNQGLPIWGLCHFKPSMDSFLWQLHARKDCWGRLSLTCVCALNSITACVCVCVIWMLTCVLGPLCVQLCGEGWWRVLRSLCLQGISWRWRRRKGSPVATTIRLKSSCTCSPSCTGNMAATIKGPVDSCAFAVWHNREALANCTSFYITAVHIQFNCYNS